MERIKKQKIRLIRSIRVPLSNKTMIHEDITEQIIRTFYAIYNELGYGFREKVYENALTIALQDAGLPVYQQHPIKVYFRGHEIGDYFADLIVADAIILEIKATRTLSPDHEAQLLNYLKATHLEVGMLLNFGIKPEFKRKYFSNSTKGHLRWTRPQ